MRVIRASIPLKGVGLTAAVGASVGSAAVGVGVAGGACGSVVIGGG